MNFLDNNGILICDDFLWFFYEKIEKMMFEKVSSGKVKIKIFKKYMLENVVQAHQDLEGRKILGPAVIVPN